MANQQGNGRNVAVPDENRPSWRPEDDNGPRNRRNIDEDDRYMRDRDDDRYQRGGYWEDRSTRDREEGYRSTERYGMGQSGYGAGRYDEDRDYRSRNLSYPPHMEERARERGGDERWQGRGGPRWSDRDYDRRSEYERRGRSGYGHGEYEPSGGGGYLGQSGQQMGWGNEGYGPEYRPQGGSYGGYGNYQQQPSQYGGRGVQNQGGMYGQGGYDEGMHGQGGMQHRYGSQGYQGWGQGAGGSRPQGMGYGQQGMQGREGMRWQSHRGKGPQGYTRSDERIREAVCEALTEDHNVDATHIDVTVRNGEVILAGTVEDRMQKRMAEDTVEQIAGVKDVQNQIRVASEKTRQASSNGTSGQAESSTGDKRHRA
jgi:osmotically-inducible protein OsmY